MKITKRQLKRIIREEYRRITESGAPGWGYQGNTGLGSEMEYPEKRNPRENRSGSFGELLKIIADAIDKHGGMDAAFADLQDDGVTTEWIESYLMERKVEISWPQMSEFLYNLVSIADMHVQGDYNSSQANAEFKFEFDQLTQGL
jgi:hypothetical protein